MMSEPDQALLSRLRGPSAYVPWDAPMPAPVGRPKDHFTDGFDRALTVLRSRPEWGKTPLYVAPAPLVPPPLQGPSPRPPVVSAEHQARIARVIRAGRVRAAQQNAIEAPFKAMAREKWQAGKGDREGADASVASGRDSAVALGFTTIETTHISALKNKRPLRDRLRVDPQAKRLKRMRSTVNHAARLLHFDAHSERNAQLWNKKFMTLTYADIGGWEPGHIRAFLNNVRGWCRARNVRLRFVWVGELQGRGALHYHVVIWLPKGKYLPFADAQGWWPHGRTNIVNAQSPIGYITKYASKATTADALGFPKGARICGHGGLQPEGRRHVRYWNAPFWVRDALGGKADIRKVVGGYMDKFTGEFLPSPWRVEIGPDGQVWAYRIDQQQELAA